jgi:F-box interacting protein
MVTEILARLPVKSLLRFRSVCKAWRNTISDDPSFVLAHLQHQPSSFLIFPCLAPADEDDDDSRSSSIALYRWATTMSAASLVHAADMPFHHSWEPHDVLAHCDGLVLVPTCYKVHLFNPAARQVVTLPWSPGSEAPPSLPGPHQAFGLGRDPRSGAYKVARFFYRQVYHVPPPPPSSSAHAHNSSRGRYGLTTGMELLTVAADRHWREIAAQPPFPAIPESTATFVKGHLLWPPDKRDGVTPPTGFLRLSLEDETFGVTPPPPCRRPRLDYATSSLSELRGDLCVAHMVDGVQELWMSDDAVRPRWERRYAIRVGWPSRPRPVALLDRTIVLHNNGWAAYAYDLRTQDFKEMVHLDTLDYQGDHPSTAAIAGRSRCFSKFFLIPYRDSLLPVRVPSAQ